jgi:hypothetical protein
VFGAVVAYAVLVQVIVRTCEHQRPHSWITAVYWAVSTMTTLGLGDVVFESDAGRLFTSVVLVSGILLFLVVLPFAFIRYFYAPWSETLSVPARLAGHVIIASPIGLPRVSKALRRFLAGRLAAAVRRCPALRPAAAPASRPQPPHRPVWVAGVTPALSQVVSSCVAMKTGCPLNRSQDRRGEPAASRIAEVP